MEYQHLVLQQVLEQFFTTSKLKSWNYNKFSEDRTKIQIVFQHCEKPAYETILHQQEQLHDQQQLHDQKQLQHGYSASSETVLTHEYDSQPKSGYFKRLSNKAIKRSQNRYRNWKLQKDKSRQHFDNNPHESDFPEELHQNLNCFYIPNGYYFMQWSEDSCHLLPYSELLEVNVPQKIIDIEHCSVDSIGVEHTVSFTQCITSETSLAQECYYTMNKNSNTFEIFIFNVQLQDAFRHTFALFN